MGTSNLMARAKRLMELKALAGAALVIVPLATAVPGRADTVSFGSLGPNLANIGTGGIFGHANSAIDAANSSAVDLSGDSMKPDTLALLNAVTNKANYGNIDFDWQGQFSNMGAPVTELSLLAASVTGAFAGTGDSLNWTLTISLLDSGGTAIYSNSITMDGFSSLTGSLNNFAVALAPATWDANLTVDWTTEQPASANDTLNFNPSIQLLLSTGTAADLPPPPSAVPLPATVWSGGTLLLALGLFKGARLLSQARSASPF